MAQSHAHGGFVHGSSESASCGDYILYDGRRAARPIGSDRPDANHRPPHPDPRVLLWLVPLFFLDVLSYLIPIRTSRCMLIAFWLHSISGIGHSSCLECFTWPGTFSHPGASRSPVESKPQAFSHRATGRVYRNRNLCRLGLHPPVVIIVGLAPLTTGFEPDQRPVGYFQVTTNMNALITIAAIPSRHFDRGGLLLVRQDQGPLIAMHWYARVRTGRISFFLRKPRMI